MRSRRASSSSSAALRARWVRAAWKERAGSALVPESARETHAGLKMTSRTCGGGGVGWKWVGGRAATDAQSVGFAKELGREMAGRVAGRRRGGRREAARAVAGLPRLSWDLRTGPASQGTRRLLSLPGDGRG